MYPLPFTAIIGVFPFAGEAFSDAVTDVDEGVATAKFRAAGDGGGEAEGRRRNVGS